MSYISYRLTIEQGDMVTDMSLAELEVFVQLVRSAGGGDHATICLSSGDEFSLMAGWQE